MVVSDNGPHFANEDFKKFMMRNGIKNIYTPPFHPRSNGPAERAVRTFKEYLRKVQNSKDKIERKVLDFLWAHRINVNSATQVAPASLMFGRKIRTRLDMMREEIQETNENKFKIREEVFARDYRGRAMWKRGLVTQKLGRSMYEIQIAPETIWRRHENQLRKNWTEENPIERGSDHKFWETPQPSTSVSSKEVPRNATAALPEEGRGAGQIRQSLRVYKGGPPQRFGEIMTH